MEPRRPRISRKATRHVEETAARTLAGTAPFSLPHIAELMDHGEIPVGVLNPIGWVAVVSDADSTLAMRERRKAETLLPCLARLDQAIDKALTLDIFTDEINPQSLAGNARLPRLWTLPTILVNTANTGGW